MMRHFFSVADALRINKKLMAQKTPLEIASDGGPDPEPLTKNTSSANIPFSAKEINAAMAKARELLAA
ncbi:hypothetical protein ACL9RI_01970 [Janthinobacterium sp. Mn2066]|uniref:hypothetical protein n=1 Tax=Janthinobacterium sp. Mn2066 TaxID=3395264 RepID=UPI003BE320A8